MIYAVIAVFNRKEFTVRCLEALAVQTVGDVKYIVVDDGSTDGTAEIIKQHWPNTQIITGPGNWWWAKSMQVGVEYALTRANSDDYIVAVNNDQYAKPDAIEQLVASSKKNATTAGGAIVGSVSIQYDDKTTVYDTAHTINWDKHAYTAIPYQPTGEYTGAIDVLTCRLTLFPVPALRVANFDGKHFPHYLGDNDLSLQLKQSGYKLVLSYDSIVYDVGGSSNNPNKNSLRLTLTEFWHAAFAKQSHSNLIQVLRLTWRHAPKLKQKLFFSYFSLRHNLYLFVWACIISAKQLFTSTNT